MSMSKRIEGRKIDTTTTIEFIRVADLKVDPAYQRSMDERRAHLIGESLDLSRIGVLTVSRRADRSVVVIDGQHRHGGLVVAGLGGHLVRCEVHHGLDRQGEAALFRKLNGGRKPIGALDDYRAALEARDPVAVEIDAIVTGLKLKIQQSNLRRVIAAVKAVKSVHLRQRNLERTLSVLAQWDDRACTFNGELLKSVSIFLAHYAAREDAPAIDDAHLVRQLRGQDPEAVLGAIKRRNDGKIIRLPEAGCSVLLEIYNRRAGKKRLPPYIRGGQSGIRTAA
jgi:hypothetical protein